VFFFALSVFTGMQIQMVTKGWTTLEYHNKRRSKEDILNEYDMGFVNNFQRFFGTGQHWWTFCLPSLSLPLSGRDVPFPIKAI
jgi:hypothetical protein